MPDRVFRRQFLITPALEPRYSEWQQLRWGTHRVQAHPDLEVSSWASHDGGTEAVLLGFLISPQNPGLNSAQVLEKLCLAAPGDFLDEFDRLSGRFVLLLRDEAGQRIYSDPSALRSIVYTWRGDRFYAASDTRLLGTVIPLASEGRVDEFLNSGHFRRTEENWLPANVTLYPGVERLAANHLVNLGSKEQSRFWPREPRTLQPDWQSVAREASEIIESSVLAAHERYRLALPLTCGLDSRTLLAACVPFVRDLYIYTLRYRSLVPTSSDIAIPRRLSRQLGFDHQLIDARVTPSPHWKQTYLKHSTIAHFEDAGVIGNGTNENIPKNTVVLNGTVAETARSFYGEGDTELTANDSQVITQLVDGWADMTFVGEGVRRWYADALPAAKQFGYDLSTLFYWEHRSASWQAQSQLEWDLMFESFTPFNNRYLLKTMLSVSDELRTVAPFRLQRQIIEYLDQRVLDEPINPATLHDRTRAFLWRAKRKIGKPRSWRRRSQDLLVSAGTD